MFMASAVSRGAVDEAQREIEALLRQRHRMQPGQDADFMIRSQQEIAATADETSRTLSLLLASAASISLLVGGIGIMNIMLVSVTERTREIGIRMAIGAKGRDILTQFLIEALALSIGGGAIGIALGIGASRLLAWKAHWPIMLSPGGRRRSRSASRRPSASSSASTRRARPRGSTRSRRCATNRRSRALQSLSDPRSLRALLAAPGSAPQHRRAAPARVLPRVPPARQRSSSF